MKRKYFSIVFLILIYFASLLSSNGSIDVMKYIFRSSGEKIEGKDIVIVIDAGHGGIDPGKVGVNNILEKDINLSIAMKLKNLLEQQDIQVVMTREEDIGLYSDADKNRKRADLNQRIKIIQESNPDFAVSIHQNSYTEEYVKGAQVFYHSQSLEGKKLAELLQTQIVSTINDGNHRKAKSNSSYYMLKHTECPLVIVECGFLSNNEEATKLTEDDYQDKMALGILQGIMQYIEKMGSGQTESEH